MKCSSCGFEGEKAWKFCPECGERSSAASSASGVEADVSLGAMRTLPEAPAGAQGGGTEPDVSFAAATMVGPGPAETPSHGGAGAPLADRYDLLEEIGRGGFAVVWKARDGKMGRIVAIKRLLPEAMTGSGGAQTLARFQREAEAIARLNHRNIVAVYDRGEDERGPYIVMEFVEGGSLRAYAKSKGGKLAVPEAVALVRGVVQGLSFAHRSNLVHRDIKPANILLHLDPSARADSERVVPKIVDFGLARAGGDSELSMSGYGMGTPWYMPPEQRRDAKGVNHTADIYALGKTLYELVSGETPDNVDPDKVPEPWLTTLILKCVKSNPEERYFSCEELLLALEAGPSSGSGRGERRIATGLPENVCPACGADNAPDVKFCESCGAGMIRACPECGRENSVHKQYCGGCGTDIAGFDRARESVERMERYSGEKRWARTIKEVGLLEEKLPRLPGGKGVALLAQVRSLLGAAKQAVEQGAATVAESERLLEQGELEAAIQAVARSLSLDPGGEAASKLQALLVDLKNKLGEFNSRLCAADFAGAQAVADAMREAGAPARFVDRLRKKATDEQIQMEAAAKKLAEGLANYLSFEGAAKGWSELSLRYPASAVLKERARQAARFVEIDGERQQAMAAADFTTATARIVQMEKAGLPEKAAQGLRAAHVASRETWDSIHNRIDKLLAEANFAAAAAAESMQALRQWPDSEALKTLHARIQRLMSLDVQWGDALAAAEMDKARDLAEQMSAEGLPDETMWGLLGKIDAGRKDLDARIAEARRLVLERRLDVAADAWASIATAFPKAKAIRQEASRAMDALRQFERLLAGAKQEMASGSMTSAREQLEEASERFSGHDEARRLLDEVNFRLKRRRRKNRIAVGALLLAISVWAGARMLLTIQNRRHLLEAEALSAQGNVDAGMEVLGRMRESRFLVVSATAPTRNHLERVAAAAYRLAAEKGDAVAMYRLGICLHYGIGLQKDAAEALKWFTSAAQGGNVEAQKRLYELAKGAYQDAARPHFVLLEQYGAEKWDAIQKRVKEAEATSKNLPAATDAFHRAQVELPAAVAEAKERQRLAHLSLALEAVRDGKARGAWSRVLVEAERVLAMDPGNVEARTLKDEADKMLPPRWRLVAVVDGREVPASAMVGGKAYSLPQTFTLKDGERYSADVTYEVGGRRYVAESFLVTADWKGVKECRVTLKEIKGPQVGDVQKVTLAPGVELELVWCPPGSFTMGSPSSESGRDDDETQHRVTLTKGFWMGKYEVTQRQWEAVMGSNPSHFKNSGANAPAENITWEDCQAFIRKMNARVPGGGFRLPTEAEWEYAARGGSKSRGFTYSGRDDLGSVGWYSGNSGSTTHPVGQKTANELGLCDMSGNVWEWCQDWYQDSYSGLPDADPKGPSTGSYRVFRGGGWISVASNCRSANRSWDGPSGASGLLGFRVVLAPVP